MRECASALAGPVCAPRPGAAAFGEGQRKPEAHAWNGPTDYPATLEIDYPDHDRDWFTTLLRPLLVVPIAIVLALVSGPGVHGKAETWLGAAGGILFFATVLMLVFRQKYPGWWFDWNVALTAFGLRVVAYLALLHDEYPSTDEEQAVHLYIAYPDAKADLNRWLPLVKWSSPSRTSSCCACSRSRRSSA